MATFYVSPTGNDASAGTSTGTAFRTLTRAQTAMAVGDTAILMNGTFSLAAPLALTSADNNTTWIKASGATPILNGGNLRINLISLTGASGVTLSGISFLNTAGTAGDDFDSAPGAVMVSGGSGNVITGCTFTNVAVGVNTKDDAADVTISYNHFTDTHGGAVFADYGTHDSLITQNVIVRSGSVYTEGASIDLFEAYGNTVSHNSIDDIPRHGIEEQNFDAGHTSGNNIIEYNIVTRYMQETADGGGIYLFAGDDPTNHLGSIVRYNYVEGQGVDDNVSWGIYLDDYISNCQVYGNFVNGGGVASMMVHGGDFNQVYNNIFMGGRTYGVNVQESAINPADPILGNEIHLNLIYPDPNTDLLGGSTGSGDQWFDNIYVAVPASATAKYHGWNFETFQTWQTVGEGGEPGDVGSVLQASAQFVNEAGGDYRFAPGSTALSMGMVQLPWDLMGPTEAGSAIGSDGSAHGQGAATAVSRRIAASRGTAAGVGAAAGGGRRLVAIVGAAAGTGAATAVGRRLAAAAGTAAGTGVASGFSVTATSNQGAGSAAGTGAATGFGNFVTGTDAIGASLGTGTAAAVGFSLVISDADGAAAGTGSAIAYTSTSPVTQNYVEFAGSAFTVIYKPTGTFIYTVGGPPAFPAPVGAAGFSFTASSVAAVGARVAAAAGISQGGSTVLGRAVGPIPAVMQATITIGGVPYLYDPLVDGVDRGTYFDPLGRFAQQSIEVRRVDQPNICVHFRFDVGVDRQDVVIEQGLINSGALVSITYSIIITKDGITVFSGLIQKHDARTSWRWQSAPRVATVTISELLAQHLLPPLDIDGSGGLTPAPPAVTYTGYGSHAGMTAFMSNSGERHEIGPLTEYQSRYALLGDSTMLSSSIAQAEAMRSYEWVVRDETTGGPFDYRSNTNATMYPAGGGNPQIMPSNTDRDEYPATENWPNASYLRFIMTGDPYDLETMQMGLSWSALQLPLTDRQYFCATLGVRAHAWHLRQQAILAKVTPIVVPSWLLPQAYYQADLSDNLYYMTGLVDSVDPVHSFVRAHNVTTSNSSGTMPDVIQFQPSQDFIQAFIFGWVVWMGFTDWQPILEWKSGLPIALTDGTSGWIRARPALTNMAIQNARVIPSDPDSRPPMPTTWDGLWALNQSVQPANMTYTDANMLEPGAKTYASYLRAALVMAAMNGVTGASACAAWLDSEFERILVPSDYIDIKWSYHLP